MADERFLFEVEAHDEASEELEELEEEIEDLDVDLERVEDSADDASDELDGMSASVGKMAGGVGAAVGTIAGGAAALRGMATAARTVITTTADFGSAIRAATAKVDASQETYRQFSQAAIAAGQASQFSATQAGEGLQFLAQAGFTATEASKSLPGVLKLAEAAQMDLAKASDIASNVLSGFNLEVEETGRVNDVLVKTASTANASVQELGVAFEKLAPIANSAGISIEKASSFLGVLHNAGLKGTKAASSLTSVISRLQKQSGKAGDVLDRLGVTVKDSEGNLLELTTIFERLDEAGISSTQTMRLFGKRGAAAANVLMQEGAPALREYQQELKNAEGAAREQADFMKEGLNAQLEVLQGSLETLAVELGEEVTPELAKATKTMTRLSNETAESSGVLSQILGDKTDEWATSLVGVADATTKLNQRLQGMTDLGVEIDLREAIFGKRIARAMEQQGEHAEEMTRRLEGMREKADQYKEAIQAAADQGAVDTLRKLKKGLQASDLQGDPLRDTIKKVNDELRKLENRTGTLAKGTLKISGTKERSSQPGLPEALKNRKRKAKARKAAAEAFREEHQATAEEVQQQLEWTRAMRRTQQSINELVVRAAGTEGELSDKLEARLDLRKAELELTKVQEKIDQGMLEGRKAQKRLAEAEASVRQAESGLVETQLRSERAIEQTAARRLETRRNEARTLRRMVEDVSQASQETGKGLFFAGSLEDQEFGQLQDLSKDPGASKEQKEQARRILEQRRRKAEKGAAAATTAGGGLQTAAGEAAGLIGERGQKRAEQLQSRVDRLQKRAERLEQRGRDAQARSVKRRASRLRNQAKAIREQNRQLQEQIKLYGDLTAGLGDVGAKLAKVAEKGFDFQEASESAAGAVEALGSAGNAAAGILGQTVQQQAGWKAGFEAAQGIAMTALAIANPAQAAQFGASAAQHFAASAAFGAIAGGAGKANTGGGSASGGSVPAGGAGGGGGTSSAPTAQVNPEQIAQKQAKAFAKEMKAEQSMGGITINVDASDSAIPERQPAFIESVKRGLQDVARNEHRRNGGVGVGG